MMDRRRLLAAPIALASAGAAAQGFPNRPIRFVVPWAAGGAPDITARTLASHLADRLGQAVVVENRSGASGNIGMDFVAKAAPDGHTLALVTWNNAVTGRFLEANLTYAFDTDFALITVLAELHNILLVPASLAARDVPALVALAKARPGGLNYATTAIGSVSHLGIELLMRLAGIRLEQVQYRGAQQAQTDVARGDVSMFLSQEAGTKALIEAGQTRALAVASPARSPSSPNVPTFAEQGLPGLEAMSFFSLAAPAATPQPVLDRLQREAAAVLALPEVRERLEGVGAVPVGSTPAEGRARVAREVARWGGIIREAGIHAS